MMKYWLVIMSTALFTMCAQAPQDGALTREAFIRPPIRYWPRPLWFWNNTEVTA